jgi:hypothetical protein
MRNARTSIMLALAILAVGSALSCSGDASGPSARPGPGVAPVPGGESGPAVLTALQVTPAVADLCAVGNTVQLAIAARDQTGTAIPIGSGTAAYSSSAPNIAVVSAGGIVAAVAPGTARITATFTFADSTRTTSMNATVHEVPAKYPHLAGVYDLKTLQTISTWGMEGTIETAIVTIEQSRGAPVFTGTFADFSMYYYADDTLPRNIPFSGSVTGSVDCAGGVVLELHSDFPEDPFWVGHGTLDDGRIVGDYVYPSDWQADEGGTFTAERRYAE